MNATSGLIVVATIYFIGIASTYASKFLILVSLKRNSSCISIRKGDSREVLTFVWLFFHLGIYPRPHLPHRIPKPSRPGPNFLDWLDMLGNRPGCICKGSGNGGCYIDRHEAPPRGYKCKCFIISFSCTGVLVPYFYVYQWLNKSICKKLI